MTGYLDSPVVSESGKKISTPGVDLNVDCLLDGVYDNEDWDFDGARGGKSAKRKDLKRKFLDSRDACRTRKRMAPTDVTELVELA